MREKLLLINKLLEVHHLYFPIPYFVRFIWLVCIPLSHDLYSNNYMIQLMEAGNQSQEIVKMKDCNIVLPLSDQDICYQTYFEALK